MNSLRQALVMIGLLSCLSSAGADDSDIIEGEKLYTSQCKLCHGMSENEQKTSFNAEAVRYAAVVRDTLSVISDTPNPLAFAPPFGPNLRGVYMRPAGIEEGYIYSTAFLKNLKGIPWNDAALDVWITNPQTWVPGVYMFYKQPNAEIRRKIIAYLKANP